MKLTQRYEYFISREELDKFIDKFPGKNLEYKVVFDGEKKWALEIITEINEVKITINDIKEVHKATQDYYNNKIKNQGLKE